MANTKSLDKLLQHTSCCHLQGPDAADVMIAAVTNDSRKVTSGALFVAVAGEQSDGHRYIGAAVEKGCGAVVVDSGQAERVSISNGRIAVYCVEDTRRELSLIVAAFYDYPQKALKLIGLTGTNGKTTISYLLEKVLEDPGEQVGVLGTIGYRYSDSAKVKWQFDAPLTTPDPLILQKMLRRMVDAGVTVVIMEASSHALVQQRLAGIRFDIAAFTNLSHDHLDYHASMEEYFRAKSLLFTNHLKHSGTAVITFRNDDSVDRNRWPAAMEKLLQHHGVPAICCGSGPTHDFQPKTVEIAMDNIRASLQTPQGVVQVESPLVGRFNVENIMTTLAIAFAMKIDTSRAAASLARASGAPGRLERITLANGGSAGAAVFVDYAHTPDALLNVLRTLQGLPHNRLICVFGCGGDRDRAKRPLMGSIAARYADIAVVTDDNPRSEPPGEILQQILEGIHGERLEPKDEDWLLNRGEGRGFVVLGDRHEAIRTAVQSAGADDIVIIAGKGHEKYQLTNQGKRFFDDSLEVRQAMLCWNREAVAEALQVNPVGGAEHVIFQGISTDTRTLRKNEVFLALQGESFDGHRYIDQALRSGASGLIVDQNVSNGVSNIDFRGIPVYKVPDTLEALGALAAYRRTKVASLTAPQVVAITGSSGKTTIKEMTAAIFAQQWPDSDRTPCGRVLKTSGNFNNRVGLPLSLLPMELKHRAVVLEMGMNTPGEIARLTAIADPDIGCIVNVHGAHLEGMGSIEGVAREKECLFAGCRKESTLVVNLDDAHVLAAAEKYEQKKVFYTMNADSFPGADMAALDVSCQADGTMAYELAIGPERHHVALCVPGKHNVANSLAAAAIAHAAGIEAEAIITGLAMFRAPEKRMEIIKAAAGYSIINDTYNANPVSMRAGLETLAMMPGGAKIAVLGDMLELGESSGQAHFELGEKAAQYDLAALLLTGAFAKRMAAGAVAGGMARQHIELFNEKRKIADRLNEMAVQGALMNDSWIFIKASRGIQLETVVERLIA
ncbi:MAG: UDP-N-acetylmuramoyl-L-alanyl-D-glutamate--2,6-diaminopimelate ligase [Desulfopila sp.]